MASDRIALIDMDGTLCDYDWGMRAALLPLCNEEEGKLISGPGAPELHYLEDEYPYWKARMDLVKQKPGWWATLPEITLGFMVMNMCANIGFAVHILTKGPRSTPAGWTEKVQWIQAHITPKHPNHGMTVTTEKGGYYGRVLVDDYPPYIKSWLEFRPRGTVIMPDQPWNRDFRHPQVIRVQDPFTNSAIVRDALQAQFDRKGQ